MAVLNKAEVLKHFSEKKFSLEDLRGIMRILRSEEGCPWDREQTHQSIRKNFIEETYEVCEAIDKDDMSLLREELGDVLLQIVFHSQMEEEKCAFTLDDVIAEICEKLIIRHPHVFSDAIVSDSDEVLNNWQTIKQETKGQTTAYETLLSVPRQLPALMRSQKLQGRAKKASPAVGHANIKSVFGHFKSKTEELEAAIESYDDKNINEELGDVMFAAVNIARYLDKDAEELLTASCDKFVKQFRTVEMLANENGINLKNTDSEAFDMLWKKAKGLCDDTQK